MSFILHLVESLKSRFLTQSVRKHLQPLNPLIFMKLQTINTVETIVLYQIERRVHGHLVEKQSLINQLLQDYPGLVFLKGTQILKAFKPR